MTRLAWADIFALVTNAPQGRLWGVPRGGAIVAGLTGRAVDDIEDADVVVDDIVDSGATEKRYRELWPTKPFWPLMRKQKDDGWVVFPWEESDPTADLHDTVRRQLEFIGEDPNRDGLRDTPDRVLRALTEMTCGYQQDPKEILSRTFSEPYDEMIILRDIEFVSLCEHHMLTFAGHVNVGYIPGKVVGISKLARLVDCFSRRLQIQERMTHQIATAIREHLDAPGVAVTVEARHSCMACRGIRKANASMVTSAMLGLFRDRPEARAEFLGLCRPETRV